METFDEIYARMKAKYIEESGSEFLETSDIAIRLRVLAGEIYNAQTSLEWLKKQMFVNTASGENLDYLASERGLKRKEATKAKGEIMFMIPEAVDHKITIPKGAVVSTNDKTPIRFCTTETEEIGIGGTFVSVYAEAEQAGSNGNIQPNTATVPVSVPAEIVTVKNPVLFEGGADEESDEELRSRIKATFISQANGANAAYYKQLALSVSGVKKAGVIARVRGTGTVNVYVCGNGEAVDSATLAEVQNLLNEKRELVVDVQALNATFINYDLKVNVVAKAGYEDTEVKNLCTNAFKDYLNTIPIGGKLYLSALGKSLLETGCIENYEFDTFMQNQSAAASQCFKAGTVTIGVE